MHNTCTNYSPPYDDLSPFNLFYTIVFEDLGMLGPQYAITTVKQHMGQWSTSMNRLLH